ncbi:MAG: T9SS type A sorting domain-containing protein [Lewinellaceae bacterium]|nr:T9SS type A sorting domain-containing protein [Lewinellaceae bacterium]
MKTKKLILTLAFLAQFFIPGNVGIAQRVKLTASDGEGGKWFGYSVSVSGDYALIGAPHDNPGGVGSGSAYIFKREGTAWIQQAKLVPSDGAEEDGFGFGVSVSGDYALIGAARDDDNGLESGSAYIFKREGTVWIQQAKLAPIDGAEGDEFGWSVSVSGDYAVIGAAEHDDSGPNSGAAYVFKREGETWVLQAKLVGDDGNADDQFGCSVAVVGDYTVIGARHKEDASTDGEIGAAYVFKREGETWVQQAKLVPDDWEEGFQFGFKVSIFEDYAIIGAPGFFGMNSAAYIFKREAAGWTQQVKLPVEGWNVSISDSYAIIGWSSIYAYGYAHVLRREGTNWTELAVLTSGDTLSAEDGFGSSASISGKYALIGDPRRFGLDLGAAYIYDLDQLVVGVEDSDGVSWNLYPNPANRSVTIVPPTDGVIEKVVLYDLAGRVVYQARPANNTLALSELPKGIYLLEVEIANRIMMKKLIVD